MKFNPGQAIYLQIADYMTEQILNERWTGGDRIPSVREIASLMQVNPNTVMRSFTFLQDHAVITNRRGVGYFVADMGLVKAREWKRQEFIEKLAPGFFQQAQALDIDDDQLLDLYRKYRDRQSGDE